MIRIGLVACSKTKADQPAPARDLYQGTLFRRASAYIERMTNLWYILSAKHGLVHPDTVLEPYDVSLYDMNVEERREWAKGILGSLELVYPDPYWLILAGKRYREFVVPGLEGTVNVPLAGMGIGEQIAWLDAELEELSGRCRMCKVRIPTCPGGLCSGCLEYVVETRMYLFPHWSRLPGVPPWADSGAWLADTRSDAYEREWSVSIAWK